MCPSCGPLGREIDHAARIVGFTRATEAIHERMPDSSRQWLARYVDGLNHYQSLRLPGPPELRLFGLRPEPWTVTDVLGVGRLLCADYTWLTFMALLPARRRRDFARTWQRVLDAGCGLTVESTPRAAGAGDGADRLQRRAGRQQRGGRGSARAGRSAAPSSHCDPHLGLSLPNIWLLVGLRSPSCQVVGFMLAGLPFVCIGRNPDVAWGGTNLRAASSDLYDVSALPASDISTETTTHQDALVRDAPTQGAPHQPRTHRQRCSPPRRAAGAASRARWVGHEPTDEVTPFLRAARARDAAAFRAAFAGYGVPAQTMVFGDRHGCIGRLTAATLPVRPPFTGSDFVRNAGDPATHWQRAGRPRRIARYGRHRARPRRLGQRSAAAIAVPIGFLFDCGDRARQLQDILGRSEKLSPTDLTAAFDDASSPTARRLARRLLREIEGLARSQRSCPFDTGWPTGTAPTEIDSSGAVAFEVLLARLVPLRRRRGRSAGDRAQHRAMELPRPALRGGTRPPAGPSPPRPAARRLAEGGARCGTACHLG